jgi:hypothetical protein
MKATWLPRSHVSSHSLRYGGATELAAAGFPQYVISTYGGWTENSRALHIYTRLSQCTNELVSKHMSRAGMHRTVQTVVNDLLMHRQERSKHAQVFSGSDSSTDRPTKSRKGSKPRENGGKWLRFAAHGSWMDIYLMHENIAIVMGNHKHPIIMESSMIVSRIFAENSTNVLWDWVWRQYSRQEDRDQMGRARNRLKG